MPRCGEDARRRSGGAKLAGPTRALCCVAVCEFGPCSNHVAGGGLRNSGLPVKALNFKAEEFQSPEFFYSSIIQVFTFRNKHFHHSVAGGATWFALGEGDEIRDTNTPSPPFPNV